MINSPLFSINRYDRYGDIVEKGVFLEFGETSIKVCDSPDEFDQFIEALHRMSGEIKEHN